MRLVEAMNLKEELLRGIYRLVAISVIHIFPPRLILASYGYETPSAVQSRAIMQICKGRGQEALRKRNEVE